MLGYGNLFPAGFFLRLDLRGIASFDDKDVFAPGLFGLVFGDRSFYGGAVDLFELLGKLPAEGNLPVFASVKGFREVIERALKVVGSFVDDHGPGLVFETLENLGSFLFIAGNEAFENKTSCVKPRKRKCGDACAGSGKGCDGYARFGAHPDKVLTGIRYSGGSGIRDECDVLALT